MGVTLRPVYAVNHIFCGEKRRKKKKGQVRLSNFSEFKNKTQSYKNANVIKLLFFHTKNSRTYKGINT